MPGCTALGNGQIRVSESAALLIDVPFIAKPLPAAAHAASPLMRGTELYFHQRVAVSAIQRTKRLLLCDEMGAGKTRSAWCGVQFALAVEEVTVPKARILIVAPKVMETAWAREVGRDFFSCTGVDIRKSKVLDEPCGKTAPGVYFIHYDILHDWASRIARHDWDFMIFDEVHTCASPKSKRSRAALAVRNSARGVVCLTGTPLVNKPADLWVPLTLTCGGGEWGTFFQFRQRYCGAVQDEHGHWIDTAPTNVEELRERMAPYYLRREKREIVELSNLPRFQRQRVDIDMDADALKDHQAELREHMDDVLHALNNGRGEIGLVTRLRQHTSRVKLPTTFDRVDALLAAGKHVVVFVAERKTAEKIADIEVGIPRWVATGDASATERAKMVDEFQAHAGAALIVATYQALGQGVTLTAAEDVILHDLPWTFKDALQAEARVHRIGQTKPTTAHWMVVAGSIDDFVARVLIDKARALEAVGIDDAARAADDLDLESLTPQIVVKHFDDALSRHFGRL